MNAKEAWDALCRMKRRGHVSDTEIDLALVRLANNLPPSEIWEAIPDSEKQRLKNFVQRVEREESHFELIHPGGVSGARTFREFFNSQNIT